MLRGFGDYDYNEGYMALRDYFCFKIGGPAGFGIKSIGLTFSKVATRSGYHVYTYSEYPSLIRGGHNVMQVTVSDQAVYSPVKHTSFLIALNQETIELHKDELGEGAGVLFDSGLGIKAEGLPAGVKVFEVPLAELVAKVGGKDVMRNTAAMGAALTLLGADLKHFKDLIAEEFKDKPPEVIALNYKVVEAGSNYAKEKFNDSMQEVLKPKERVERRMVINANESVARAAIAAGLKFAAIYPMTPTTNILHNLAPYQEKYGFIYKQPEDEIAAITMALGASNAGARSMVATSGGGFCLMSEAYGLAGITETPIVIIEGMRGGPATGLPTWTEQGDLRFVLHTHQGDFPRIVLAAGDAEEAFYLTLKAFNLADKYQTPVVLLVDKMICESDQSYGFFDYGAYQIDRGKITLEQKDDFKRYKASDDGISERSVFGSGNHFIANADEHDEYGYSNEEIGVRNMQMNKRMKKLEVCEEQDMEKPKLYGPDEAEVTLVSWGSNKGVILEALRDLPTTNYLHLTWVNPFPTEAVKERLTRAKYLINVECNLSAQMGGIVAERTGIRIMDNLLKYDGRPIYPEEIVAKVKSVAGK